MSHTTEKDIKENRDPEATLPGCSQAINKKTLVTDTSRTTLNKINSIPNTIIKFSSTN